MVKPDIRAADTSQAVAAPDSHRSRSEVPVAFDECYQSEWSGLLALAWTLTGSWSTAEELTQDAFADAYRRWSEVGALDRPGAWVRRAVVNRAASHHRHRGVEQRGLTRWSARAATGHDGAGADRTGESVVGAVGDPEFWAAVRSLPERQAACVALHYLEDRSVAEIAEVLGLNAATVKVHLHRGRLSLARRLSSRDESAADRHSAPRTADPAREEDR